MIDFSSEPYETFMSNFMELYNFTTFVNDKLVL